MITLTRGNNANLSRVINSFLLKASSAGPIVMVRLPMRKQASLVEQKLAEENGGDDTWQWWDTFRCSVNFEKRLCLALEVASSDCLPDDASLKRWLGEPVKALVINTRIYLTNKKGFPVLPRSVQDVVRPFICLDVQVIIEGRSHGHNMCNYQQYLAHLWNTSRDDDPVNRYAKGFEDFLQAPLQPLMDNLESGTYEVFEKDPVKYTEYQRAIYNAIRDKVPDDAADRDKRLTVMVLGAGRGPLVRASLQAASYANRKIKVFAVEKNTNAVVTLLTQKEEEWKDEVDVISSDMRDWRPRPEDRADIVVSELLGSFGDNELSPECLYSAQHLFKPDAISIPTSYTSWVIPLHLRFQSVNLVYFSRTHSLYVLRRLGPSSRPSCTTRCVSSGSPRGAPWLLTRRRTWCASRTAPTWPSRSRSSRSSTRCAQTSTTTGTAACPSLPSSTASCTASAATSNASSTRTS